MHEKITRFFSFLRFVRIRDFNQFILPIQHQQDTDFSGCFKYTGLGYHLHAHTVANENAYSDVHTDANCDTALIF